MEGKKNSYENKVFWDHWFDFIIQLCQIQNLFNFLSLSVSIKNLIAVLKKESLNFKNVLEFSPKMIIIPISREFFIQNTIRKDDDYSNKESKNPPTKSRRYMYKTQAYRS